jgi:hypothetical protein
LDVDDGPSAFIAFDRKARKEHKCYECGRVIQRGEKYRNESGIWDGDPRRYKTCSECLSIREVFFCGGYIYGEVISTLKETFAEAGTVSSDMLADLTHAARDKVFAMLDSAWLDEEAA